MTQVEVAVAAAAAAVAISGQGNQIVLDFSSLREALQLWKPWSDGKKRSEVATAFHEAFHAAGVCLQVKVQGRLIASLGGDQMTGLLLPLLGHHPAT